MAQKDQASYDLALEIFQQKYVEKRFEYNAALKDIGRYVTEYEDRVHIHNYGFLLSVFKYFGHVMAKFSIAFNYSLPDRVMDVILKYSTSSLIQLRLVECSGSALSIFNVPFKNLQRLEIGGYQWETLQSQTLKFNQLFPQLHRLTLEDNFEVIDKESVIQKFPHLNHFQAMVGVDQHDKFLSQAQVKQMLLLNPTIRSLALTNNSEIFLKNVVEILPELDSLEIKELQLHHGDPERFDDIYFKHVRKLKITSKTIFTLKNTHFEHLQDLSIDLMPNVISAWESFINNQKGLIKLTMKNSIDAMKISHFAEIWPKLEKVLIHCDKDVDGQTIEAFVKRSKELKVLTLENFFDDMKTEFLLNRLGNEWNMRFLDNENPENGFQLRRIE